MKASEVHPCDGCGGVLLRPSIGVCYVVRCSIALPNARAIQRRMGLRMLFAGQDRLAEVFLDDHVLTVAGEEDVTFWEQLLLCFDCYTCRPLAAIAEMARARSEAAAPELAE